MDEELKRHLEAMESRLMARINGVMERLLEVQGNLRDLRSEHSVTRDMVIALPGVVLGAIEAPLLKRIRTTEERLDKLRAGRDGRVLHMLGPRRNRAMANRSHVWAELRRRSTAVMARVGSVASQAQAADKRRRDC